MTRTMHAKQYRSITSSYSALEWTDIVYFPWSKCLVKWCRCKNINWM